MTTHSMVRVSWPFGAGLLLVTSVLVATDHENQNCVCRAVNVCRSQHNIGFNGSIGRRLIAPFSLLALINKFKSSFIQTSQSLYSSRVAVHGTNMADCCWMDIVHSITQHQDTTGYLFLPAIHFNSLVAGNKGGSPRFVEALHNESAKLGQTILKVPACRPNGNIQTSQVVEMERTSRSCQVGDNISRSVQSYSGRALALVVSLSCAVGINVNVIQWATLYKKYRVSFYW